MRRISYVVAAAALSLAAVATPVSAASPTRATVSMVQGIPRAVVNVCVDGRLVRSAFRYGGQLTLSAVTPGTHVVRVYGYTIASLSCHGTPMAARTLTTTAGLDETAVLHYIGGRPGLQVFTNNLSITTPGDASITVRHTAIAPSVAVWIDGGTTPAVASLARNGSSATLDVAPGVHAMWVSAVGGYQPVIGPRVAQLAAGKAYQVYGIGTGPATYRFVVIVRDGM